MFKSFQVKNFRCFKDLTIGPLERVNLIAGKNNVGKSALLEALWMLHEYDNPQTAAWVNIMRGLGNLVPGEQLLELYRNFDPENKIELSGTDMLGGNSSLEIKVDSLSNMSLYPPRSEQRAEGPFTVAADARHPVERPDFKITFHHTDSSGQNKAFIVTVGTSGNVLSKEGTVSSKPRSFFLAGETWSIGERLSEKLSELKINKRDDRVIELLKILEPNLQSLMVAHRAGAPAIYADVQLSKQLPVSLMGDGIRRLLAFALLFEELRDRAILIDEIENGFHYSVMIDVWKAIKTSASQFNLQIFATTHSDECIRAAHEAFSEGDTYDFRLHRLDSIKGEIESVTYDQETLAFALEQGWEVR
jgi:hypothetical protein